MMNVEIKPKSENQNKNYFKYDDLIIQNRDSNVRKDNEKSDITSALIIFIFVMAIVFAFILR